MNLIKCPNGHYYDFDKFEQCPHCAMISAGISEKEILKGYSESETVVSEGNFYDTLNKRKTVGWITSISGENAGQCINLYEGRNTIGKINYDKDSLKSSSENRQITITYSITKGFILNPNKRNVTIDDNSITKSSPLNDRAIITVDSNKYIFVALCNEDFTW